MEDYPSDAKTPEGKSLNVEASQKATPATAFRKTGESRGEPKFHKPQGEDGGQLRELLAKVEFRGYHNERQSILRETVAMLREDILSRLACRQRPPVAYDAEEMYAGSNSGLTSSSTRTSAYGRSTGSRWATASTAGDRPRALCLCFD